MLGSSGALGTEFCRQYLESGHWVSGIDLCAPHNQNWLSELIIGDIQCLLEQQHTIWDQPWDVVVMAHGTGRDDLRDLWVLQAVIQRMAQKDPAPCVVLISRVDLAAPGHDPRRSESQGLSIANIQDRISGPRLCCALAEHTLARSGLPHVTARTTMVYGYWDRPGHWHHDLMNGMVPDVSVLDPNSLISPTHVTDLVSAIRSLVHGDQRLTINIAAYQSVTLRHVLATNSLQDPPQIMYNKLSPGIWDINSGVPDLTLLQTLLPGWESRSYQQGRQQIYQWLHTPRQEWKYE